MQIAAVPHQRPGQCQLLIPQESIIWGGRQAVQEDEGFVERNGTDRVCQKQTLLCRRKRAKVPRSIWIDLGDGLLPDTLLIEQTGRGIRDVRRVCD